MALEVGQGNKNIRVHHSPADFGLLHIFAAFHRDLHLIVALQSVGNDDVAAGGIGGEAVDIGGFQVIQSVFPTAHIQRVAVRQEGLAALALHQIYHHLGPVGTQIGQVPRLTKVHLDGDELTIHVDVAETGGHHQTGQLLGKILPPAGTAEIREIHLCFFCHVPNSFSLVFPECCCCVQTGETAISPAFSCFSPDPR